jgi:hypothetical protein
VKERTLLIHDAATAQVGAYENAKCHVGAKRLTQFDIIDFFNAVTYSRVAKVLSKCFTQDAVVLLARLTTTSTAKWLPPSLVQGAPTSTLLADVVCYDLDTRLVMVPGIGRYTRYVDDITFSGAWFVVESLIAYEIALCGFSLNMAKTKHSGSSQQMLVTGFLVNEQDDLPCPRAPRRAWRRLRAVTQKLESEPRLELYRLANGVCAYLEQTDKERAASYRARIAKCYCRRLKDCN